MALNINGTTGISGVEGSVSAPVLTGTDSNCGISFPAADTIKFSTGGVERMQITNSGVTGTGIGAGKILQVVHVEYGTQVISTSTSLIDTGLTLAITPIQTGSKMLVTVFQQIRIARNIVGQGARLGLLQDSTTRFTAGQSYELYVPLSDFRNRVALSSFHLHGISAGTSTTYKVQAGLHTGSNGPNMVLQDGGSKSMMSIMEVAT